jgi:LPS export ABC transporter protein LptC
MNTTFGRPWWVLLPIGRLIVFLVFNPFRHQGAKPADAETSADYELHDSRIDRLDETGRVSLRLLTATALHRPRLGGTEVSDVTVLQPTGNAAPNRLHAPRGFVPDDGALPIRLAAPVRVEVQDPNSRQPWHLEEGEMDYHARAQRLESRQPVTVTQGGTRLEAQGLEADVAGGRLVLIGRVRALYAP